MTKTFILKFKLETFAGELEATHEEIESIPDFVVLKRIPENDFSDNRGNLINYTEAYEATAEKPFSITVKEIVTFGERDGNEYTLTAEEVSKMQKYNCFWRKDSSEMVSFLRALEPYIGAGVVAIDEDDNDGTALNVACDFAETFEQMAEEYNIEF